MSQLLRLPVLLTLIDDPDVGNLRLLRKKMLAELELAGGQTLRIGKKHYTKDDLIKMFDAASGTEGDMEYVLLVARNTWLRRFMTEGRLVHPAAVKADDPLLQSEGFARFALPYLQEAYWRSWKFAFESVSDGEAYAWSRVAPAPVFVQARQYALSRVREYLEADLRATNRRATINEPSGGDGRHTQNLVSYCAKIVRVLCELPESFQDLKTAYARAWADVIITKAGAYSSTVFLDSIDYLHDLLPAGSPLHHEFKQRKKAARRTIAPEMARQQAVMGGQRSASDSNFSGLWMFIWLLIMILRFCH